MAAMVLGKRRRILPQAWLARGRLDQRSFSVAA